MPNPVSRLIETNRGRLSRALSGQIGWIDPDGVSISQTILSQAQLQEYQRQVNNTTYLLKVTLNTSILLNAEANKEVAVSIWNSRTDRNNPTATTFPASAYTCPLVTKFRNNLYEMFPRVLPEFADLLNRVETDTGIKNNGMIHYVSGARDNVDRVTHSGGQGTTIEKSVLFSAT